MVLLYFNMDDYPSEEVGLAARRLPPFVFDEISQYKFVNDQKSRLLGRLLVQKHVLETTGRWSWSDWKKNASGKPMLENGPFFNISHSGSMVAVVVCDAGEVGVDVEQTKDVDVAPLAGFLHPDEIEYLERRHFDATDFYMIWTRKEAYLKAKGEGIINGVHQLSMLDAKPFSGDSWEIRNVALASGYQCAVCSEYESGLVVQEISYSELKRAMVKFPASR